MLSAFKILVAATLFLVLGTPAFAGYRTTCQVEGGKAKGYVITDGSMTFSGRAYIHQYDDTGRRVDSDWEVVVVIVVGADSELVAEVDADDDATYCELDVSDAVGDLPDDPSSDPRYRTSCVIRDGKAMGYVHTRESMSFSGRVFFKIYDDSGRLIDEEWELAVVIVVGASTELVEETDVSDDAALCTLDISDAVGG